MQEKGPLRYKSYPYKCSTLGRGCSCGRVNPTHVLIVRLYSCWRSNWHHCLLFGVTSFAVTEWLYAVCIAQQAGSPMCCRAPLRLPHLQTSNSELPSFLLRRDFVIFKKAVGSSRPVSAKCAYAVNVQFCFHKLNTIIVGEKSVKKEVPQSFSRVPTPFLHQGGGPAP